MPLLMERSKSKNGAEILDSFVLSRHNSQTPIVRNRWERSGKFDISKDRSDIKGSYMKPGVVCSIPAGSCHVDDLLNRGPMYQCYRAVNVFVYAIFERYTCTNDNR